MTDPNTETPQTELKPEMGDICARCGHSFGYHCGSGDFCPTFDSALYSKTDRFQHKSEKESEDRIAALERENAELRKDRERLDWLESDTCTLECFDIPTGGGDADVGWRVIEYHMSKPFEREIGSGRTPREAIDAALAAGKEQP